MALSVPRSEGFLKYFQHHSIITLVIKLNSRQDGLGVIKVPFPAHLWYEGDQAISVRAKDSDDPDDDTVAGTDEQNWTPME